MIVNFTKQKIALLTVVTLTSFIIGIAMGYAMGMYYTVKILAKIGSGFIDEELLMEAIRYAELIMGRYPPLI